MINWLNCVWESDLPPYSKYLACYLRKFMNDNQDMAWPSYDRMTYETGLARATVNKYLNTLESYGFLQIDRGKQHKNTVYMATFPTKLQDHISNISGSVRELLNNSSGSPQESSSSSQGVPVVHQMNSNKQRNKQYNKQIKDNVSFQDTVSKDDLNNEFEKLWKGYRLFKKEINGKAGTKENAKCKFNSLFRNMKKDKFDKNMELMKQDLNNIFDESEQLFKTKSFNSFTNKHFSSYLSGKSWLELED